MRDARLKAELGQLDVALRIGVSLRTLQRWEYGEGEPTLSRLAAYAKATGTTLTELLSDEVAA